MLEKTILSNLILNEDYCRKVFPYLKEDYFDDTVLRKVFETASEYMEKYKEPPSLEALKIAVDKRKDLNEDTYQGVHQLVDSMSIEKRIYRFRCVEGWSMVIPWNGFQLSDLLDKIGVKDQAKYVAFETLFRPEEMYMQKTKIRMNG